LTTYMTTFLEEGAAITASKVVGKPEYRAAASSPTGLKAAAVVGAIATTGYYAGKHFKHEYIGAGIGLIGGAVTAFLLAWDEKI
ncbi:MAG: hypothetical protein AAB649_06110, partial [Patescibacteria group bacterium]